MVIGMGDDGAGTIWASRIEKNSPSKLTGLPSERLRRISSDSSMRRPTRPRVDATDFELVRILAADPHAEHEPARCEFGDAGKLARHEHRVAQRKQVKRDVARQVGVAGEQSSGVDQGVCARSDEEADVIVDADVIDSGFGDVAEQCVALPGRSGELADRGEDAHSNSSHAARLAPRSSAEFAWR